MSNKLECYFKITQENEKTLIRESINGKKYLIFDKDSISYARVGHKIGEYETIEYDGSNGDLILMEWIKD